MGGVLEKIYIIKDGIIFTNKIIYLFILIFFCIKPTLFNYKLYLFIIYYLLFIIISKYRLFKYEKY